jgi:DNA-binding CsgD family transcriptional regulator
VRRGRPPHPDVLTPREWEVLALIREGLTNDQIALRLGLTERGARFHVSEIVSKLGVDSRKEAAEWQTPRKPFAIGGLIMTSGAAAAIAIAVLAMAALAIGIYAMNSRASGTDDPSGAAAEEKATADFLSRVEAALTSPDKVARVLGWTEFIGAQGQAQAQWSTDALYDLPNQSARVLITKDPSSRLDIPDQRIELTTGGSTYDSNLGDREPVSRFSTAQRPACFPGEPLTVVLRLLCWEHTTENVNLNVEGVIDFEGRKVQSLALTAPNGATNRLLVDPGTYLPIAQTVTAPGQGSFSIRTVYAVEILNRSDLSADFFDPRSLGYVPPQEAELAILDDPALPVRVYWPGRILSGTQGLDAQIAGVERRHGQQVGRDGPGQALTISYAGPAGRFRLDYWPMGNWEEFQRLLGGGFIWAQCSERHVVTGGPGEIVILKGFDPGSRPLAGVQIAGATPIPTPPLFPNGCPSGEYNRFMAQVSFPEVTVTINAPYGVPGPVKDDFGMYDSEAALEEIARRLRPRQPEE